MSSPRTLVLDARSQTVFESGATLLALLAFPSAGDPERAEIAASLCESTAGCICEKSDRAFQIAR